VPHCNNAFGYEIVELLVGRAPDAGRISLLAIKSRTSAVAISMDETETMPVLQQEVRSLQVPTEPTSMQFAWLPTPPPRWVSSEKAHSRCPLSRAVSRQPEKVAS